MARITVIMGIYNCAPTLPAALESLLAQTYQDFKVVLCDDGSTDDTYQVGKQYADMYENIMLIKNERNLKLAATLNHCLKYADTEYVARMDGDDLSLPTRFEKQISFLDAHPEYALVSCPMIYYDEDGDYGVSKAGGEPSKAAFKHGTPFCHAPVMMRREALTDVGNYTAEPFTERIEDVYLWYKFFKAGYRGFNLAEPLYKMFNGRDAFARRKASDRIRSYKTHAIILNGLGYSFPYVRCIPDLLKILVPKFVIRWIVKRRK